MKKSTIKKLAALAVVAAIAFAVYKYAFASAGVSGVNYKTANIEKRDIVVSIEATGTVEPEDLVDVGARVSGEIVAFGKDKAGKEVDYGSEIAEGDIIALIDDQIQQSNFLSANARLEASKAAQAQAKAGLRNNNKGKVTGSITVAGNVKLVAGVNIELANIGRFSGKWHVMSSAHTINNSDGYVTTATLRKIG